MNENGKLNVVFFARAMQDYGTDYEQTWIENIEADSCSIIDFSKVNELINNDDKYKVYGKDLYEVERKYFFPLIDQCNYVVAAPAMRRGQFTAGVIIEIEYALSIGKKVFGIVDGIMKQITIEDLRKMDDDIIVPAMVPGEAPLTRKDLREMKSRIGKAKGKLIK